MKTLHNTEVAIVVGATGAFGQAIVDKLTSRGLRIIAVARSAASLDKLASQYTNILPCVADISDDSAIDAIQTAIAEIADWAPETNSGSGQDAIPTVTVRAVIHGPGVGVAGGILEAPTATMVDAVNIKVGGMLRLTRAADQFLTPDSRLIAIAGHYGLEPTAYAASAGVANAALFNVMRQLSLAYGERGITAHALAPGPADTERLRNVAVARAEMRGCTLDDVLGEMLEESSLKAFTTPEQVAWAINTLLDPEASAMTGSTLMLDAGRRRGLP